MTQPTTYSSSPRSSSPRSSAATLLTLLVLTLLLLTAAIPTYAGGTPATGTLTDQLQTAGGGGARPDVGDYVSANRPFGSSAKLDAPYFYWIEVSEGATDLEVDIFDADILAGPNDIAEERDQNRDSDLNTKVRYKLFDPAGNRVPTRFAYGDDVNPESGDKLWKLLYDNDTAGITGGDTFADNFGTASYSNNDGSNNWTTDWIENNDLGDAGDDATTGDVQITGGELSFDNQSDAPDFINQPSLEREADLSSYVAAELSFDYRTLSGVDRIGSNVANIGDSIAIDISDDGGATWWVLDEIGDITGVQSGTESYDITDYISTETRIRIRITNRYAGTDETIFFDNVQIRGVSTANGGAPTAGHWLLQADTSGDVNGEVASRPNASDRQDDVNAFGLRAHDGDETSGGSEYNVYAESFITVGINNNGRTRDYDFFPYITSGCDFDHHDWDWDGNQTGATGNVQPYGDIDFTSRDGSFTDSRSDMSDNNSWYSENTTGFATVNDAADYGIWSMEVGIEDWGQNNYGVIYLTEYDGAATPPTSQPEPDTFRIYLPNDAGTAPAKAYISQFLTYADQQSTGPNPPTVGNTSRFIISLVATNPTGAIGDIDFSTSPSRLVTANIPGGEVVYGGQTFVTGGTVVSQPSIGGSGDITWNPGTLSPGESETLAYFIDVTPAAPGSVTVTGTVGSGDGTRGTWLDETGDSARARAIFDFGELCPLEVATDAPTPVMVSSFEAHEINGAVVLEWQTGAEAETAFFDVYRMHGGSAVKINNAPLSAQMDGPQGGTYWLSDPGARSDRSAIYYLVEHTTADARLEHGPFAVKPQAADRKLPEFANASLASNGFAHASHATRDSYLDRLAKTAGTTGTAADPSATRSLREAKNGGTGFDIQGADALYLSVTDTGLYRVPVRIISNSFGLSRGQVLKLVARDELRLSLDGEPVKLLLPHGASDPMFFARAADSPFYDRNVYRLTIEGGESTSEVGAPVDSVWQTTSFREQLHVEQNLRAATQLPLDPESDLFYWSFVSPNATSAFFDATVPGPVAGSDDAILRVNVWGASQGEHHLAVKLNGEEIGQVLLSDLEQESAELPFGADLLSESANQIEVELIDGGIVLVESFDIDYERRLEPVAGSLLARLEPGSGLAAVGPFIGAKRFFVLDVSEPNAPRWLPHTTTSEADGTRVVFDARDGGTFFIASSQALNIPVARSGFPSELATRSPSAEYLVISTASLAPAARSLASLRAAEGLSTLVVDVQEVYDVFAHGKTDARAIRSLLTHAAANWQTPPRYVVLVGSGSYDYIDHLGFGDNLIGTLQASRGTSLFASDTAFVDLDGDGVPSAAIGRIPALTNAEAQAYVDKLAAYEASTGDWSHRVVLLSDDSEPGKPFAADNQTLSTLLPYGVEPTFIDLDTTDATTAGSDLIAALDQGVSYLHYSGHGAPFWLTDNRLLDADDVSLLQNGERLPIVSSATCHIGLHALPGAESLGESLVLEADGGAAAVLGPTWLSEHAGAALLADRLFRQIFQQEVPRLGDALLAALASAASDGAPPELLGSYQILGDPAAHLQIVPDDTPRVLVCPPGEVCNTGG